MSDNASYGFVGLFISTFVDSLLYSIVKILVKFAADIAVYALVFVISSALFNTAAAIMVPFVGCFILVMYYAFKGGLTACWGAGIAVDGKSIFGALKYSVKTFFFRFSPTLRDVCGVFVFTARNQLFPCALYVRSQYSDICADKLVFGVCL